MSTSTCEAVVARLFSTVSLACVVTIVDEHPAAAAAIAAVASAAPPRRSRPVITGPPLRARGARERERDACRHARVVDDERGVRADRGAAGELGDAREEPRRQRRAGDARGLRVGGRPRDRLARDLERELVRLGDGDAGEEARAEAEAEVGRHEVRRGRGVRAPTRARGPAPPRVEPGHLLRADRDDRDPARLEVLERVRQVEDRLGAGADDGDGGARELLEVGGDVRVASPPNAPRWTPPIPPVAKTSMPAARAAIIVAETVVPAHPPAASDAASEGRLAFRAPRTVASSASSASGAPRGSGRRGSRPWRAPRPRRARRARRRARPRGSPGTGARA